MKRCQSSETDGNVSSKPLFSQKPSVVQFQTLKADINGSVLKLFCVYLSLSRKVNKSHKESK